MAKFSLERLRDTGGRVILVGSTAGEPGEEAPTAYGVYKSGLRTISRAISILGAPLNVDGVHITLGWMLPGSDLQPGAMSMEDVADQMVDILVSETSHPDNIDIKFE